MFNNIKGAFYSWGPFILSIERGEMKSIWITWENQRRNKGISYALGWELYDIVHDDKSKVFRYFLSFYKTLKIILKEKPQIVAAQNPSIVLSIIVLLFKKIFCYKLIIDAHNSGIFPLEGRSKLLMFFSRILQKSADLTLVTNEKLKSVVNSNHGRAFVLPDKIPQVPSKNNFPLAGEINVAYICTFSDDEPYKEVVHAAKKLSKDIYVYITGKYEGKININSIPPNVKLLGFISEKDYWALLNSVDLVMDLTTREDCLVCGAYEGIALSKPLILSDTNALRSYFNKGCVYVDSTSESIVNGIKRAVNNINKLKPDIKQLKLSLIKDWNKRIVFMKQIITTL